MHPSYKDEVKERTKSYKIKYDQASSEDIKGDIRGLVTSLVYAAGFESFDVGVFTVNEETPMIPVAKINFEHVESFESVVIGGYGCTNNLYDQTMSETLKSHKVNTMSEDFLVFDYQKRKLTNVMEFNFITAGLKSGGGASICLGDSGGPVYLKETNEIVGVNSNYTFKDSSGISYTNTHARLSSIQGWLEEVVKTSN